MAGLKDAPEERKARTRPLKEFNKTVSELEERIQLDEDVESALIEMREAFNVVNNLHRAYLAARQGSDSEECEDDPQDVKWMDKVKASRNEVLSKFSRWRKAKEDEIAIRAAFLEQENVQLKWEVARLKSETSRLRTLLLADSDNEDANQMPS